MYPHPAIPSRQENTLDFVALDRLYRKGSYRKALHQARRALLISPDSGRLWALAAASATKLGLRDEAERYWRRAVQGSAPGSVCLTHLGQFLIDNSRPEEAIEFFRQRLAIEPSDAAACAGLGVALVMTCRFPQALTILSEAVRLQPENVSYLANLGRAFELAGLIGEARKAFALAAERDGGDPGLRVARARMEHLDGDSETALRTLENARKRWPAEAAILNAKGLVLSALGCRGEAEAAFRSAIERDPKDHSALANLASQRPMKGEKAIEARLRDLLDADNCSNDKRISLLFTLAKIEEDKEMFEPAYAALTEANQLRKSQLRYDPQNDRRMFEALKREFRDARTPKTDTRIEGPVPIFITGLPRSGTTLTESILAGHPQVAPMGERDALMHAVRRAWLAPGLSDAEKAKALAEDYRTSLPVAFHGADFVTDKMPLNFRFIGHIVMSMPEARIVHVTRDAKATCWSIFRHNFSSFGNAFAYDPDDIIAFHALYRDLMDFWQEHFPGRIITLDYDALVGDQQHMTQRFLDELGLRWDEACLSPEKTSRSVLTASSEQVRRKVYSGSSLQWKRYEKYAGTWLDRLNQAP